MVGQVSALSCWCHLPIHLPLLQTNEPVQGDHSSDGLLLTPGFWPPALRQLNTVGTTGTDIPADTTDQRAHPGRPFPATLQGFAPDSRRPRLILLWYCRCHWSAHPLILWEVIPATRWQSAPGNWLSGTQHNTIIRPVI